MASLPGDHAYDVIYRATADFTDLFAQVAAANAAMEELKRSADDTGKSGASGAQASTAAEKARTEAMKAGANAARDETAAQILLNRAENNGFNTPQDFKNFRDSQETPSLIRYNQAKNNGYLNDQQALQALRDRITAQNAQNASLADMRAAYDNSTTSMGRARQATSDLDQAFADVQGGASDAQNAAEDLSSGLQDLGSTSDSTGGSLRQLGTDATNAKKPLTDMIQALTDLKSARDSSNTSSASSITAGVSSAADSIQKQVAQDQAAASAAANEAKAAESAASREQQSTVTPNRVTAPKQSSISSQDTQGVSDYDKAVQEADKSTAAFDDSLKKTSSDADSAAKSLDNTGKSADDLGTKTARAADDTSTHMATAKRSVDDIAASILRAAGDAKTSMDNAGKSMDGFTTKTNTAGSASKLLADSAIADISNKVKALADSINKGDGLPSIVKQIQDIISAKNQMDKNFANVGAVGAFTDTLHKDMDDLSSSFLTGSNDLDRFSKSTGDTKKAADDAGASWKNLWNIGKTLGSNVDDLSNKFGGLSKALGSGGSGGGGITGMLASMGAAASGAAASGLSTLGGIVGSSATAMLGLATAGVAAVNIVAALATGLAALFGALGPLVGIFATFLPIILGMGEAFAVLLIAVKPVAAAIKDLVSPTQSVVDTGNKILSQFSPAVQQGARDLATFIKGFSGMNGAVKDMANAVFTGALPALNQLQGAQQPIIAALEQMATAVGKFLNPVLSNLVSFIKGPLFQTMSGNAAKGLEIFGNTLASVMDTLEKLGAAAAPYMVALAEDFSKLASSIDGMVTTASKNGQLKAFFDQMLTAFEEMVTIFENLFKVLADLGEALAPLGNFLLRGIASALETIDSDIKKIDWTSWISAVEKFFSGMGNIFQALLDFIGSLINPQTVSAIGSILKDLGDILKTFQPLGKFIGDLVGGALKDMAAIFHDIAKVLEPVFSGLNKIFTLLDNNKTVMNILSGILAAIGTLVVSATLIKFVEGIASWVGSTIKSVIDLINKLPGINLPGGSGNTSEETSADEAITAMGESADKAATSLDALAAAADRAASAADSQAAGEDKAAAGADTEATAEDRAATGADTQATAEDRAATGADTEATAEDRAATGADTQATAEGRSATAADTQATSEDRAATGADTEAASEGRAATAADTQATAEGRAATSADTEATAEGRAATAADTEATAEGRAATAADTEATAEDRAATSADTEAAAEDKAAVAADGESVSGAGGTGGLAGALNKLASGLGLAVIGNQLTDQNTKAGSPARKAGDIGSDAIGGAVVGSSLGPEGAAVGAGVGTILGIAQQAANSPPNPKAAAQGAVTNPNNIHVPSRVQTAGGETTTSAGNTNNGGDYSDNLAAFNKAVADATASAKTAFTKASGELFSSASPGIQTNIAKPMTATSQQIKGTFDRISGGLFGEAPKSVPTSVYKPMSATAQQIKGTFDKIAGGLFGEAPKSVPTSVYKPMSATAQQIKGTFDKISGGLFGEAPKSVPTSVYKPMSATAQQIKGTFDKISGGLFGEAPKSVPTSVYKPMSATAQQIKGTFDRISGGLFGEAPKSVPENVYKPMNATAQTIKGTFDRIAGGLFGKTPPGVDTNVTKPVSSAATTVKSAFDRIAGDLFGKLPPSLEPNLIKPVNSAAAGVKSAFDGVAGGLFGKAPPGVDSNITKPTTAAHDGIKNSFDTLSTNLFAKVPANVTPNITKAAGDAGASIKSAFDGISTNLFGKVPGSVDTNINKPTSSSHDTIKSAFDTLSGSLFDKAPANLDTNVNQPISKSQGTAKTGWDTSIGTWFDKALGTYQTKSETPMHDSITSKIPGFWNSTIPNWFTNVGPHFVTQVETPMGTFLTGTLPPSIQTAFKNGMNQAISGAINPAIGAVNAVVGVIPGINQTLKTVSSIFAEGGHVPGQLGEPDNSDSVLTRLTPGEYVIRKKAAQKLGPDVLEWLNHADKHLDNGNRHDHPLDFGYPNTIKRAGGGLIPTPNLTLTTGQAAGLAQNVASSANALPGSNNISALTGTSAAAAGAAAGIVLGALQTGFDNLWAKNIQPILTQYGANGIPANTTQGIDGHMKSDFDAYFKTQDSKFAALGGNIPTGDRLAIIDAALQADGIPKGSWPTWEAGLNTLITRESAWDAGAVNNYDSNAAAGTPSEGLAQVIAPTFAAYRNPSLPDQLTNPIANVAAAINYINAAYGGINNVQQANANLPPKGYAHGGSVTRDIGFASPHTAVASGSIPGAASIQSGAAVSANGGRSGPGLHIENMNISNPLPEQVGDSLQRVLTKYRVYGARQ